MSLPRMLDDLQSASYTIALLALVPVHPFFGQHVMANCSVLTQLVFAALGRIQERGLVRPLGDLLFALLFHTQHGAQARITAENYIRRYVTSLSLTIW